MLIKSTVFIKWHVVIDRWFRLAFLLRPKAVKMYFRKTVYDDRLVVVSFSRRHQLSVDVIFSMVGGRPRRTYIHTYMLVCTHAVCAVDNRLDRKKITKNNMTIWKKFLRRGGLVIIIIIIFYYYVVCKNISRRFDEWIVRKREGVRTRGKRGIRQTRTNYTIYRGMRA